MSGLEVAGVVLGAIPIVIESLSAYRAGKGVLATMRKSHGLVDELIHRLEEQRLNFYLDILELLREAKVPEILAEESDPSPDRCIAILQSARTGHEIEQYLGHLYHHFLKILRFHEKCLQEIANKLSNIVRLPNASVQGPSHHILSLTCTGPEERTIRHGPGQQVFRRLASVQRED